MKSAPRCSVCSHDSRAAIDQAILNQKSLASIARTFGFTYKGKDDKPTPDHKIIARHRDRCMPDAYQEAVKDAKTTSGLQIANRLKYLDEQVDLVIETARKGHPIMVGDAPLLDDDGKPVWAIHVPELRALLAAVREGRQNAELLGRLAGTVTDPDDEALEAIRQAQSDPKVRAILAELDRAMADADTSDRSAE